MSDFKAKDISIKIQKKIFGSLAKKNVAKIFIDDISADLMDNLHKLAKLHCSSKKEADKVVKNIIKIIVKIGVTYRNNQFNEAELKLIDKFKQQLHTTAMTIISYHEVEFSYDRNYALRLLNRCKIMLKDIVARHLTDKSFARIDLIFAFFTNPDLMDQFFRAKDGELKDLRCKIINNMNELVEKGDL